MAYDEARGVTVLFGGFSTTIRNDLHCCDDPFLNDTWTWDGTSWTPAHPSVKPPARQLAVMVYDGARQDLVLFGGYGLERADQNGIVSRGLTDTWTWNGERWTQVFPAHSPPPLGSDAATYDPFHRVVVLFHMPSAAPFTSQTWTWDGIDWAHVPASNNPGSPGRYIVAGIAYHAPSGGVILLMYVEDTAVTWHFNGAQWTRLLP